MKAVQEDTQIVVCKCRRLITGNNGDWVITFSINLWYWQFPPPAQNIHISELDAGHSMECTTPRRPLDRLFALSDPVTLIFDLFTYCIINWWVRIQGLCLCRVVPVILVSAVLVLLSGETDRHTDTAKRFTPATVVDMSNLLTYCGLWLGGSVVEPANFHWSSPDGYGYSRV